MLKTVFQVIDVASLWIIWWCAAHAFASAPGKNTWKVVVLKVALLVVVLSAFMGGITLYAEARPLRWWVSGLLYGVAVIALWWYDHRFGIREQCQLASAWMRGMPERCQVRARRRNL